MQNIKETQLNTGLLKFVGETERMGMFYISYIRKSNLKNSHFFPTYIYFKQFASISKMLAITSLMK